MRSSRNLMGSSSLGVCGMAFQVGAVNVAFTPSKRAESGNLAASGSNALGEIALMVLVAAAAKGNFRLGSPKSLGTEPGSTKGGEKCISYVRVGRIDAWVSLAERYIVGRHPEGMNSWTAALGRRQGSPPGTKLPLPARFWASRRAAEARSASSFLRSRRRSAFCAERRCRSVAKSSGGDSGSVAAAAVPSSAFDLALSRFLSTALTLPVGERQGLISP
mmetsp:Transcript_7580/g.15777  ORF Transcript_7580/g.15777 Transcript_7580/m.15777 type:complete len:219 (+) Transcript_7580:193-849(+)